MRTLVLTLAGLAALVLAYRPGAGSADRRAGPDGRRRGAPAQPMVLAPGRQADRAGRFSREHRGPSRRQIRRGPPLRLWRKRNRRRRFKNQQDRVAGGD